MLRPEQLKNFENTTLANACNMAALLFLFFNLAGSAFKSTMHHGKVPPVVWGLEMICNL